MQVNEYDFKIIRKQMKELDLRLTTLEHEIGEFKSWHESRFPKNSQVEFTKSLSDKQDVEE